MENSNQILSDLARLNQKIKKVVDVKSDKIEIREKSIQLFQFANKK